MECLNSIVAALVPPVLWWVFLNGCDEFVLDCCFLYFKLIRRTGGGLPVERLQKEPERRVALFVPLWKESAVVEEMVDHNMAAIDYRNYDVFLGVYPNDPRTLEKALLLEERHANVHRSLCPHDGPTNKADCLNWIYQRMLLEEQERGFRYEIIVQHDAEDIVHPKALRVINSLAGEFDMIQVPVFPLATSAREFTHGTYCDEFAEFQIKDLLTRHLLGGFVPSTGVGTAFRREALDDLALEYRNQIFNVATVTEDYDIGLRFRMHDKRQRLVWEQTPNRNGNGKKNGNGKNGNGKNGNGAPRDDAADYIATREYFPRTFRQAVRQKSRWVMGVALQAWEHAGWPWRQFYWVWRDRKGLIGNPMTLLCNLIFVYCLARWIDARLLGTSWTLASIFPPHTASWFTLWFNTAFLVERLAFRIYCVNRVYGWRQALWSLPRTFWANLINFSSTVRALYVYAGIRFLQRQLQWSKTAHAFPDRPQLMEFKRRLGELLLESRRVSAAVLEKALSELEENGERLGEFLVHHGVLTEVDVLQALGRQQGIPVCEFIPNDIPLNVRRSLTARTADKYEVVPVEFRNGGTLVVAGPEILIQESLHELQWVSGFHIQHFLTTPTTWRETVELMYSPGFRLGDALVRAGLLREECILAVESMIVGEALEDDETEGLTEVFEDAGLELRRLGDADIEANGEEFLPVDLQRALRVIPVERRGDSIVVAVARVLARADRLRIETACRAPVKIVYTPRCDLDALLARLK